MIQKEDSPQEAREFLLVAVDRFRQSRQLRRAVTKFESLYTLSEELNMFDRRLLEYFPWSLIGITVLTFTVFDVLVTLRICLEES
ncbi:MAG: hypothetical protein ACFFCW_21210, partial [Candidatus Hodarchaeota archaeon]